MPPTRIRPQELIAALHPEKYRQARPAALIRLAETIYAGRRHGASMTMDDLQRIGKVLQAEYNESMLELPIEDRPDSPTRIFHDELALLGHYGSFYSAGRQVFHLAPELVDAFRRTDVEGVPAEALSPPFNSLYLAFGPQEDLDIYGDGLVLDGAYLSVIDGAGQRILQIWLTCVPRDLSEDSNKAWPLDHCARHYYTAIDLKAEGTITEAVEAAFRKSLQDALDRAAKSPEEVDTPWGKAVSRAGESALRSAAALDSGFPVMKEALRLIVNAVCFLTAYPDRATPSWGESAPAELVEKAAAGLTPKKRRVAENELRSQGYVLVRYCHLEQSPRDGRETEELSAGGSKKRTHWRRGHWRNQAFGGGRQQHKLVWIMPFIVNKEGGGEVPGHLYLIEKSEP